MRSSGSPSPGTPEHGWLWRNWPTEILLPVLVALLQMATFAPLWRMALGPEFGLSGGRPSPSPVWIPLIWLTAFLLTRLVRRQGFGELAGSVLLGAGWLITLGGWWAISDVYSLSAILSNPIALVDTHGYHIPPLLVSLLLWWLGMQYAQGADPFAPEELRGVVQRTWLILLASLIIAAATSDGVGASGLASAQFAVPAAMILSVALVSASEVESTRRLAIRRGGRTPNWSNWGRLVGGFAAVIGVLSLVVLLLLGAEAVQWFAAAMGQAWSLFTTGLAYVAFGVFYVLYWVVRGVVFLLGPLFPDSDPEPPEPPEAGEPEEPELAPDDLEETSDWAMLFRFIGLILAVIIVAVILLRLRNRGGDDDDLEPGEEERSSVFSRDLAMSQLRGLFRRRGQSPKPERLDLGRPPGSVREAMVFLHVQAQREGLDRTSGETSRGFTERLDGQWQGLDNPLGRLRRSYESVRYSDRGETPDDPHLQEARSAWEEIHRDREAAQEAEEAAQKSRRGRR